MDGLVAPKSIFDHYFTMHAEEAIINRPVLLNYINYTFSNTIRLIDLGIKVLQFGFASSDPVRWKAAYLDRARRWQGQYEFALKQASDFHIQNVLSITSVAQRMGAKVIFSVQPYDEDALFGGENDVALSESTLAQMNKIPTERLRQINFINLPLLKNALKQHRYKAEQISSTHGYTYVDLEFTKDNKDNFGTGIHYTTKGGRVIASTYRDVIVDLIKSNKR